MEDDTQKLGILKNSANETEGVIELESVNSDSISTDNPDNEIEETDDSSLLTPRIFYSLKSLGDFFQSNPEEHRKLTSSNDESDCIGEGGHIGVRCDGCDKLAFIGKRYKCASCLDYDLCEECYEKRDSIHPDHVFNVFETPVVCLDPRVQLVEDPRITEGWRIRSLGDGMHQKCDYGNALKFYSQSLALFEDIKYEDGIATLMTDISSVHSEIGDFKSAAEFEMKSLSIYEKIGSVEGEASVLGNIAATFSKMGDLKKSIQFYQRFFVFLFNFERALKLEEKRGDLTEVASLIGEIGQVYFQKGDLKTAKEHTLKSLKIYNEVGNRESGRSSQLMNLGSINFGERNMKKSLENFEKALKIKEKIGDHVGMALILENMGVVYLTLRDHQKSLFYHKKCVDLYKSFNDHNRAAISSGNSGLVYYDMGKYDKSLECFHQALEQKQRIGNVGGQTSIMSNIGKVYEKLGKFDEALKFYKKSLCVCEEIGNTYEQALNNFRVGMILHRQYQKETKKETVLSSLKYLKCSLGQLESLKLSIDLADTAKREISSIEVELELDILNKLKTYCSGTKLDDFIIVKKVGGIEFENRISKSRSTHGANSTVFFVRLKKHPEVEAILKAIHLFEDDVGDENIMEEYNKAVMENEISKVMNEHIMNFCHSFIDEIPEEMEDLDGIRQESVFLVYPKCEMDLLHKIKKSQSLFEFPFNELEALRIVNELLKGIVELHKHQIVHCDMKNDNFLVTARGNVMITDFEFKKQFNEDFKVRYSKYYNVGGAVFYLPPEISCNLQVGKFFSEVFGVGMCAYSLFSKESPFGELNNRSIGDYVENYVPLEDVISKEFNELVYGMINPEFCKRLSCYEALEKCSTLYIERSNVEREMRRRKFMTIELEGEKNTKRIVNLPSFQLSCSHSHQIRFSKNCRKVIVDSSSEVSIPLYGNILLSKPEKYFFEMKIVGSKLPPCFCVGVVEADCKRDYTSGVNILGCCLNEWTVDTEYGYCRNFSNKNNVMNIGETPKLSYKSARIGVFLDFSCGKIMFYRDGKPFGFTMFSNVKPPVVPCVSINKERRGASIEIIVNPNVPVECEFDMGKWVNYY